MVSRRRMVSTWKYMLFLALALTAIYVYAPPKLEDLTKARWVDRVGLFITKSLAPVPPRASDPLVDPIAAANVDEDLDYRIAQRTKSADGWRSFLTAHPDGPHAHLARAELDKLVPSERPAAPVALQASNGGAQTPGEAARPDSSSVGPEAATPASDEICRQDEDRLERLSNSLTADGLVRSLIELRCEKLRPQLIRLAERLDDKAPATAAAQGAPSSAPPAPAASEAPLPPPRARANEPRGRPRSALSSRGVQPKHHANPWAASNLPQLLSALLGEAPRNSTGVHRSRVGGAPGGGGGQ
jgi:hypothetical protein